MSDSVDTKLRLTKRLLNAYESGTITQAFKSVPVMYVEEHPGTEAGWTRWFNEVPAATILACRR